MFEIWKDMVFSYLRNMVPLVDYRPLLVEMKEKGVSKEQAYLFLTNMLEDPFIKENKEYNDRILDLLDYVCGYVAPIYRIWEYP